ncbi:GRAM domain-containing protein 2B-like [Gadus macrocephalus]|uniref:GRAM domain-containing protein 2B-like n=1 Tax=Gadus macrocephalus TaxID=80720 RepID=UPI0028CB9D63|nr:GRAM domain-containing protein 2B-like [Gadus macrocephalus]
MNRRFSLDGSLGTPVSVRGSGRSHKGFEQKDPLQDAHVQIKELHHSLQKDSPQRDPNIGEEGLKRFDRLVSKNSFRKHNLMFHKLFEDIPETETLTATFTCYLQKELIYHGRVFVSEDHICFHSSVLLKHIKVVIAASRVCHVKKHKAPVPMLSIHTFDGAKYNLMYVKHSKTCYELLESVCLHIEKKTANTSPQMSSAENGGNGMASGHSSNDESRNSRNNSISLEEETDLSLSQGMADGTMSSPTKGIDGALDLIFYIFGLLFLLLVLVSGYIGLRIIALEEQLTALGHLSL